MPPQQLITVIHHELPERHARQRPIGHHRLIRPVVNNFPALGIIRTLAQRLAQRGPQPAAAPQVPLQDWPEQKRIQRHECRMSKTE
jgi:hypothetical protein